MTRSAIVLFLLLTTSALINAQASGDNVFAGIKVHQIKLEFSQPLYWDSLTAYYDAGKEQDLMARATIDGVLFDSISVRLKAGASYNYPNNKKPFRITFGDHVKDQRWDGLKGIHLNNAWGDPTFMREKLHLDFCRDAGITAPRANFAELFLNGKSYGLYSLVEHVDRRFLASRFDKDNGNLYKAVDGVDGPNTYVSDLKWYGNDLSQYTNRYELKTDLPVSPWTDLAGFTDTLNNSVNTASSLPKVLNVTSYCRALAADILLANLDSYISGGRNYFLYNYPSTGKFEWIVWDANLSFGAYQSKVERPDTLSIFYVRDMGERPLAEKVYSVPALKTEYLGELTLLYNKYFLKERMTGHIDSIASVIRPYVYADSLKQFLNTQFEKNIISDQYLSGPAGGFKPGLKSFVDGRRIKLLEKYGSLILNCKLTVARGDLVINELLALNDYIKDPAGETDDWIELHNTTGAYLDLSGIYLSDNPLLPKKFRIPHNTLIAPNGYIIVWADEQASQEGLHASFRLSADGELLTLSNTDGSLLDSVTFGPQALNRSMSRIPDGTGPFVQTTPTFKMENPNLVSVKDKNNSIPARFDLKQNYPNPFNPSTQIKFSVEKSGWAVLNVYNSLGQLAATLFEGNAEAGRQYSVRFDASGFAGGIYFYRLTGKDNIQTKRMALVK